MKELGQLQFAMMSMFVGVAACRSDSRADLSGAGTEGGISTTGEHATVDTESLTAGASTDGTSTTSDATDESGEPQKFDTLEFPRRRARLSERR